MRATANGALAGPASAFTRLAAYGLAVTLAACAAPPPPGTPPPLATALPIDRAALAARVREELLFSWRAYERYAWSHDELKPLSKAPRDWHGEPLLLTPVDALDTLLLAGLPEEAAKAKALIVERLSFDRDGAPAGGRSTRTWPTRRQPASGTGRWT